MAGSGEASTIPHGVKIASATEFWERFSFYTVTGLLPLILVASPGLGGFGWSLPNAVLLSGLYSGAIFIAPSIGGWIASYAWGERRAVVVGGLCIACAQIVMAAILMGPDRSALSTSIFFSGLALSVIGTGLFKPAISAIVGLLYTADDPGRSIGFNLFMRGVWAGSVVAAIFGGAAGEKLGWQYGFILASLGMLAGLTTYIFGGRRSLAAVGQRASVRTVLPPVTMLEKRRIAGLAILSVFTAIYAISFYQQVGLYHIAVEKRVDRVLLGYEIPATWFLAISTLTFVVFSPIVQKYFDQRTSSGRRLDVFDKACIGLVLASAAQLLLLFGPFGGVAESEGSWGLCFIVAAYVLFGLADLHIWPPQIAAAAEFAPRDRVSLTIGIWYVSIGLGSYLAGYSGQFSSQVGMGAFITFLALLGIVGSLVLFIAAPRLRALMGDR